MGQERSRGWKEIKILLLKEDINPNFGDEKYIHVLTISKKN